MRQPTIVPRVRLDYISFDGNDDRRLREMSSSFKYCARDMRRTLESMPADE